MNNPSKEFELIRLYPEFSTDPATGRVGEMYYNTASSSVRVCTSPAPVWVDVGSSGANTALSNLITTAINQSLNPGLAFANTLTLGTTALPWLAASITTIKDISTLQALSGFGLQITTLNALGVTNSDGLNLITGSSVDGITGSVGITTGTPTGSNAVYLQQITDFSTTAFNFSTALLGTELAGPSFVAGADGSLASIVLRLQNATATPDTFDTQVFVYDDSLGEPGTLIGQSNFTSIPIGASATVDHTYAFTVPIPIVAGRTYYVLLAAQAFTSTLNLLGSASDVTASNLTTTIDTGTTWITSMFPDPYYILYATPARGSVDISASSARLMTQTPLKFMDADNSNYVAFRAASLIPFNITWTLPTVDGTTGQFLKTDGSGNLSFATAVPVGGNNTIAYFNGAGLLSSDANFSFNETTKSVWYGITTSGGVISVPTNGSLSFGQATGAGSLISTDQPGSLVHGYTDAGGQIKAGVGAQAAQAFGFSQSAGSLIYAAAPGSFAWGVALAGGEIGTATAAQGSEAFGLASGTTPGSEIESSGIGSLSHGYTINGFLIGTGVGGHGGYAGGVATLDDNIANGLASFTQGDSNQVTGDLASAFGLWHVNNTYLTTTVGRYSETPASGNESLWVATDPLFVVGNGASDGVRHNAFKITKDGALYIKDPSLLTALVGYVWTLSNVTSGLGAWTVPFTTTNQKELFVLSPTDITNQYIDLGFVARIDSIDFYTQGGLTAIEGAAYDYSVSYTGGAGGNTRITFLNDLATGGATPLVSGNVVVAKYER